MNIFSFVLLIYLCIKIRGHPITEMHDLILSSETIFLPLSSVHLIVYSFLAVCHHLRKHESCMHAIARQSLGQSRNFSLDLHDSD